MTNRLRILITGSSSGFGRLTATTLTRAGHHVFAGMREPDGKNAQVARELVADAAGATGTVEVVALDVTDDASVDAATSHVERQAGGLDVLVNNAGLAAFGLLETFTAPQVRILFETNVVGVVRMNRAVLPLMRSQGRGLLIHVSSVLGRYMIPFLGAYIPTKFALEALAEVYRYELAPQGIESVIVEPGTFPTAMMSNLIQPADAARADAYGSLVERMTGMGAGLEQMLKSEGAPDPQRVADAIAQLVATPHGKRPVRTIVDPSPHGAMATERINQCNAEVQAQVLQGMGMADLLDLKELQRRD